MSVSHILLLAACLCTLLIQTHAESLSRFGTCQDFTKYYVDNAVKRVGPYGFGRNDLLLFDEPVALPSAPELFSASNAAPSSSGPPAGPQEAGVDFSETNVQVEGVDEPDVIKTDGKRIYVVRGTKFHIVDVLSNGKSGKKSGTLKLPTFASDMLFEGNNVLIISSSSGELRPDSRSRSNVRSAIRPCHLSRPLTIVYQVSVLGSQPKLLATLRMEGQYLSAREVDGVARIVMNYDPSSYFPFSCGFRGGRGPGPSTTTNKAFLRGTSTGDWLPQFNLKTEACFGPKGRGRSGFAGFRKPVCGRETTGFISSCNNVFRPTNSFGGFGILSVVTVPLAGLIEPRNGVSIVSDGDKVYSTASDLFVATTDYQYDIFNDFILSGSRFRTSFHKFSLSRSGARYVASGDVSGSVLNQFSMHDFKGTFFAATTEGAPWWTGRDTSSSKVTSFSTSRITRKLTKIGEVGNLGVGERIFAVRYVADTAYVVTFREVDPLYIVKLTDPRNLRVTGELKIPGFSSYLHPVSPGRILGVGQEVTLQGRTTGAKVTLFDVSVVSKPRELATWILEGSSTTAQFDHRAFLFWKPESIAVLPVSVFSGAERFVGSIVLDVTDDGITERGRIIHKDCCGQSFKARIERNLVLGQKHLWSLSSKKLQVNNIKSLHIESTVALE